MSKPISRPLHGLIADYPYIALVSSAPDLIGFKDQKTATLLCRILSGTIMLSSFLTRAEWGIAKVMPYKLHLALDTMGGLTALVAPWILGFSKNERARNTFLVMGIFGLMASLLSEPEEM
jgi:hypothetical protein